MSISEKIYRFLIRAYSSDYRSRYGDPMEQLFRDRLREVRGFAKLIALWGGTLADWMVSVPASYWAAGTPNGPYSSFGDPARRCIFFARCEASSFSGNEVTVNHLLLGILRQQPALVPETAVVTMVRTIEAEEPLGRCRPLILNPHANPLRVPSLVGRLAGELVERGPGELELGSEANRVVTAATELAHTAGRQEVTPEDLATAILREPNSLAARLLREHIPNRD